MRVMLLCDAGFEGNGDALLYLHFSTRSQLAGSKIGSHKE